MTLSTPSEYLLEAQRRAETTTEAQARARIAEKGQAAFFERAPLDAFLNSGIYLIIITPRSGESYVPETPWPVMMSRRQTLDHLMDQIFADCSARVVYRLPDHPAEDVSTDFAIDYARRMYEEGHEADSICNIKFIGKHLTNDQILEVCGE